MFFDVSKTVLFFDAAEASDIMLSEYVEFMCILTASPDVRHTKAAIKFMQYKKLFMPPWNETELQDCRTKLQEYSFLPAEELHLRYKTWGGIPRIVFAESITTFDEHLESYLADEGIIVSIIDRMSDSNLLGKDYTTKAHWLTHMISYPPCYSHFIFEWPSLEIMSRVFRASKLINSQFGSRNRLLSTGSSTQLGKMYESAVVLTMKSFIDSRSMPTIDMYELPVRINSVSTPLSLATSHLTVNFYDLDRFPCYLDPSKTMLFPRSERQKSIDFVQAPFMFQVTMADLHPINPAGITVISKYYNAWMRSCNSTTVFNDGDWVLIFIVPADKSEYKRQKTGAVNKQYVIFMDYEEKAHFGNELSCIPLQSLQYE